MICNTLNTGISVLLRSGEAAKSPLGTPQLRKYGSGDLVFRINDASMIPTGAGLRSVSVKLLISVTRTGKKLL